jgi:ferric-dicitrate binding protein FerR (iron transport regulator)
LPFEVEADGMIVRATGTKFNVKAYPDEHTVSAVLTANCISSCIAVVFD